MSGTEGNLHIITSSDLDNLTVSSVPSADPALPESNMLDPRRGLFARWTGTPDPIKILFTRGAGETSFYASGFALARHNFPVDTRARIRLYADINQTGAINYDSGAILLDGQTQADFDNSPTTEGTFSGGTGHAVSDVITLSDGSSVTVNAVSGGAVTQFTLSTANADGNVVEGVAVTQTSTTGSGINFSLTPDEDNVTGALLTSVTIPWGAFLAGIDPWADAYTIGIPNIFAHWWAPEVAYKSLRVDIDQPEGSEIGYIDIGRLYIGWAFVPSVNFARGVSIEWVDPSKHNRTAGGGIRTENIMPYRKFDFDLNFMPVSDRERLSYLLERVGKGGDMLISLDPTAEGRSGIENTMVAKRIVNNKISQLSQSISATKLVFEEA